MTVGLNVSQPPKVGGRRPGSGRKSSNNPDGLKRLCATAMWQALEIADDLWDLANGYERPFLEQAGLLVPA